MIHRKPYSAEPLTAKPLVICSEQQGLFEKVLLPVSPSLLKSPTKNPSFSEFLTIYPRSRTSEIIPRVGILLSLTPLWPTPALGWGQGSWWRGRGWASPREGVRPLPSSFLLGGSLNLQPSPSTPPDLACQFQGLTRAPQTVIPRRRYLRCWGGSPAPGGPASFRPGPRAVPPIRQLGTPRREGRRLDGQASSVHLRCGGCLPGRDVSSVNTLLHTLQLRAPSLGTGWGREQPEEQQGLEGEWCGRLATAARPGKRLCATTRTRTGAGPRPLPTERRVSRKL